MLNKTFLFQKNYHLFLNVLKSLFKKRSLTKILNKALKFR